MTAELLVLTLAALLQVVQYALFAIPANLELGVGYTTSARDRPPSRQMSVRTARLQRAFQNHFEALILFAIAVLVLTLSGGANAITQAAAWTYLAARLLYIPAYALGLRPWRSFIWLAGLGATVVLLLAPFF